MNQAGLPHCSSHGLRKAGTTIAAENGATVHQLMAMFGWDTVKQAECSTRNSNLTRLAGEGMRFLALAEQSENKIDPPSPNIFGGGSKPGFK